MSGIAFVFGIALIYLGINGAQRLGNNAAVGLTEIIVAVVAGLILYIGEEHPHLLKNRRAPSRES